MTNHSKAEFKWLTGLAFLCGQIVSTPQAVLEIIDKGDTFFLSDGIIGSFKKWWVCEYDEDYYHKDEERDVKKTKTLLEQEAPCVVRLRRGCASLKSRIVGDDGDPYKDKYVEVMVDTCNTYEQVVATAKALKLAMKSKKEVENAIKMGELAFEEFSKRLEKYRKQLVQVYGEVVANKIMNCHGVKTRLWNDDFRDGLAWLINLVTVEKLATTMCNSLPARLHDKGFRYGIEWLVSLVGVERLPTVMCGGLVVRIHDERFREGIEWLIGLVGVERLATIMCGGLAKRLHEQSFREGVKWLIGLVGVKRLATVMCNGLAKRLHEESFREGIRWLIRLVRVEKVHTSLKNSVVSRIHDESFREGIAWLIGKGVPVENLHTAISGMAAHLHEEGFRKGVDRLIDDQNVALENLHTILGNAGVTARLHEENFYRGVAWLIGLVTVEKLHTALKGSMARRIDQQPFRDAVDLLHEHGFLIEKIITLIACDPVAARLVHMKDAIIKEGKQITRNRAKLLAKDFELDKGESISRKRARNA